MSGRRNFLDADKSVMENNLRFVKSDLEENLNQFFGGSRGNMRGNVAEASSAPPRDFKVVQPSPDDKYGRGYATASSSGFNKESQRYSRYDRDNNMDAPRSNTDSRKRDYDRSNYGSRRDQVNNDRRRSGRESRDRSYNTDRPLNEDTRKIGRFDNNKYDARSSDRFDGNERRNDSKNRPRIGYDLNKVDARHYGHRSASNDLIDSNNPRNSNNTFGKNNNYRYEGGNKDSATCGQNYKSYHNDNNESRNTGQFGNEYDARNRRRDRFDGYERQYDSNKVDAGHYDRRSDLIGSFNNSHSQREIDPRDSNEMFERSYNDCYDGNNYGSRNYSDSVDSNFNSRNTSVPEARGRNYHEFDGYEQKGDIRNTGRSQIDYASTNVDARNYDGRSVNPHGGNDLFGSDHSNRRFESNFSNQSGSNYSQISADRLNNYDESGEINRFAHTTLFNNSSSIQKNRTFGDNFDGSCRSNDDGGGNFRNKVWPQQNTPIDNKRFVSKETKQFVPGGKTLAENNQSGKSFGSTNDSGFSGGGGSGQIVIDKETQKPNKKANKKKNKKNKRKARSTAHANAKRRRLGESKKEPKVSRPKPPKGFSKIDPETYWKEWWPLNAHIEKSIQKFSDEDMEHINSKIKFNYKPTDDQFAQRKRILLKMGVNKILRNLDITEANYEYRDVYKLFIYKKQLEDPNFQQYLDATELQNVISVVKSLGYKPKMALLLQSFIRRWRFSMELIKRKQEGENVSCRHAFNLINDKVFHYCILDAIQQLKKICSEDWPGFEEFYNGLQ